MPMSRVNKQKTIISVMLAIAILIVSPQVSFAGEIFDKACGTYSGNQNTLNFSYADKGDLYFGYNSGCQYGDYSHCGMASEDAYSGYYSYHYEDPNYDQSVSGNGYTNYTIESTTTGEEESVIGRDCHRFWFYDMAALGYVNDATSQQASDAVNEANSYSGSYEWNASYTENDTWQCSKLVSRAWNDANEIVLGTESSYIRPEDIAYDSDVTIFHYSEAVPSSKANLPNHVKERLQRYKERGLDTSNLVFEYGIHKRGIGGYFKRGLERGIFSKQDILDEYQITEKQFNQLIKDSDATIL